MIKKEEYISPNNLKWSRLKQTEIEDFKDLYIDVFSSDAKYPNVEKIIKGLNSEYTVMIIKSINKIIGFAIYSILNSEKLKLLVWFGPICSDQEKFRPPGFQGNPVERSYIENEKIGICVLCESWTC